MSDYRLKASHQVPFLPSPLRLSDYIPGIFSVLPTKAGMKKAIKQGCVKVNGEIAATGLFIHGGEIIELFEKGKDEKRIIPDLTLKVLFEDDHLAVISKPAGILVSGNKLKTIDRALPHCLKKSLEKDALINPRPAHRLDFPTSGLLLVGKTQSALTALNQLFENKKIQKTYYAVTIGKMDAKGRMEHPIDGKHALSTFKMIQSEISEKHDHINLLELHPETGRRHQLRIHLANIGHPIIGDKDHGSQSGGIGKGLYLHAGKLEFVHPVTKENITITDDLPKKFLRIFKV